MTLQLFCWADDYLLCCTSVLREFHWSVCDCGFYVMFKWAITSCKTCKRLLPTPSSSNSCSTALAFFVPTEAGIFIYRKKLSKLVKGFLPCRVSYRDMTFRYCIGVYVQVRACVRACLRVCTKSDMLALIFTRGSYDSTVQLRDMRTLWTRFELVWNAFVLECQPRQVTRITIATCGEHTHHKKRMRTLERARAMKRVHVCELNKFGTRFYVRMSLSCTAH